MKNRDLNNVWNAIREICDSKELKSEVKNAYQVVYAANKTRNSIKDLYDVLAKEETDLLRAYNEAILITVSEKDKQSLLNKLNDDRNELLDKEVDVVIHKINSEASPVIVKYLSAQATFAYLEFLTDENKN